MCGAGASGSIKSVGRCSEDFQALLGESVDARVVIGWSGTR